MLFYEKSQTTFLQIYFRPIHNFLFILERKQIVCDKEKNENQCFPHIIEYKLEHTRENLLMFYSYMSLYVSSNDHYNRKTITRKRKNDDLRYSYLRHCFILWLTKLRSLFPSERYKQENAINFRHIYLYLGITAKCMKLWVENRFSF